MRVEAKELTEIFGAEYTEYARLVPLFFPRPTTNKKSGANFDFNLYMRYREYQATLGLVFALSVLLVKTIFPKLNLW
jgi:hypothetical protein